MLIAAIDPGIANTGYAILNDGNPILIGYITTPSDMGVMDRCETIVHKLEEALRYCGDSEARPRYHFAYEQFFSGRSGAVNYQRGYLDHAIHNALIRKWGVDLDSRVNSWWEFSPNLHRQWLRLDGKSKPMKSDLGDKLKGEYLVEAQIAFLGKYNNVHVENIPSLAPIGKYRNFEHITDALILALALYHAITMDIHKIMSNITPAQIKIVKQIQDNYPTIATLS